MNKTGATKVMEAINLETGEYSVSQKINIGSDKVDLKSLISREINLVSMPWSVISKIIKYSSSLVP
jgi:3-hydroxyacyl-CoA dehydrogenase